MQDLLLRNSTLMMITQFTRNQIAKSDTNEGEPGLWLKVLDKFGVGFDS